MNDDTFSRKELEWAINRGSLLAFDNLGIPMSSADLDRIYQAYAAVIGRPPHTFTPDDMRQAMTRYVLSGML